MIPLFLQSLGILAVSQRIVAPTAPDAQGFIAALDAAEQTEADQPDIDQTAIPSAEASLTEASLTEGISGAIAPIKDGRTATETPAGLQAGTPDETLLLQRIALPLTAPAPSPRTITEPATDKTDDEPAKLATEDQALAPVFGQERHILPAPPISPAASVVANQAALPANLALPATPTPAANPVATDSLRLAETGFATSIPTSPDRPMPQQAEPAVRVAQSAATPKQSDQPPILSAAELAWLTRLHIASPAKAKTSGTAPVSTTMTNDKASMATAQIRSDGIEINQPITPIARTAVILTPPEPAQTPVDRKPIAPQPDGTSAKQPLVSSDLPIVPLSASQSFAKPEKTAALPDLTELQAPPERSSPPASLSGLIPVGLTPQMPLHALPATVAAQLIQHAPAAKDGAVDVLLAPEELGHIKFQLHQHGDTVRVVLSAERPDTLDLLRRYSDQLLQEFRQAGYSEASLSFGQWGQQQKSPTPPAEIAVLFDENFTEALPVPHQHVAAPTSPSGQGLNLRL